MEQERHTGGAPLPTLTVISALAVEVCEVPGQPGKMLSRSLTAVPHIGMSIICCLVESYRLAIHRRERTFTNQARSYRSRTFMSSRVMCS